MSNDEDRKLRLSVFGKLPYAIVAQALLGSNRNWRNPVIDEISNVKLNPDNTIDIYYKKFSWSKTKNRDITLTQVSNFIHSCVKSILGRDDVFTDEANCHAQVCAEYKTTCVNWKDVEVPGLSTDIAHCKMLYKLLRGASDSSLREEFGDDVVNDVLGMPANPFVTEARKQCMDKIVALQDEHQRIEQEIRTKCDNEIGAVKRKFAVLFDENDRKFNTAKNALMKEYDSYK